MEFVYPKYAGHCISNIPSSILYLLGLQDKSPLSQILDKADIKPNNSQKVILFLLDGFGYNQWLQYSDRYTFLKRFTEKGMVAPITTVFPSTTVAALTSIHSGLTPQEHGLPEYTTYFDELDKIILPLSFTPMDEKGRDTLLQDGVDPKILFNGKTIYQTLSESHIPSFTFTRAAYDNSTYSTLVHKGSTIVPFTEALDLFASLHQKLQETDGPSYFYVYWPTIDGVTHKYGPHTSEYLAELDSVFGMFQKELVEKLDKAVAQDLAIMITADHGQIQVNPNETIYLNQYPEVTDNFQIGPSGKPILPWGSPRDVFLMIKPEKLENFVVFLTEKFKDTATILKTEEVLASGYFGNGSVHEKFKNRIGNILILPNGNKMIWYKYSEDHAFELKGMHGGLTADEILVPLAVLRGDELIEK